MLTNYLLYAHQDPMADQISRKKSYFRNNLDRQIKSTWTNIYFKF